MNTFSKIIGGLLSILILTGCEENNSETNSDRLVVLEGYLYQGEPVDSIHLTQTVSFESEDTIYTPVTDALVAIKWNDNQYVLQNIGNGYYSYSGSDLQVIEDNGYAISVESNGREITSNTTVPKKPEGVLLSDNVLYVDTTFSFGPSGNTEDEGITVTWENPDNDYFFIVIENTDPDAADIVFGNGQFLGGMQPPGRMFRIRSEPFKNNSYTINSRSLEKYGEHRIKVYRVNQEYVDLYENRQQDSRNLTEPLTNVVNGLGIFTAFNYQEAFFLVEKKQ
jgi:hypothetical protein